MRIGKRGFVVPFLATLVLTLIIFVPFLYVSSKVLFRTSEQAKDNYVEFMGELTAFAKEAQIGARKSILLIMDSETAIVYFQKGQPEVLVNVQVNFPALYNDILHIQKPSQCDNTKNCVCLFRSSESTRESDVVTIIPKRVICSSIDYTIEVESCGVGKPTNVDSYTCSNGFLLERHLAEKSSKLLKGYYSLSRRTVLYFIKFENSIYLIGDYGKQEGS